MNRAWRVFRPDNGPARGLQALVYVGLYGLCLGLSLWNFVQFDLAILWPANGVLLAACLQLPRRYCLPVLIFCTGLDLVGSVAVGLGHVAAWADSILNLVQVLVATVLTRRLCGASQDMRQPRRMVAFALGAALPAVALTTIVNAGVIASPHLHDWQTQVFMWRHLFLMEYLGLVTMTPCLLLLGQRRNRPFKPAQTLEGVALLALLCLVVTLVFMRSQPVLFAIFIPVIIMAYRLTPPWVGAGLILVSIIAGVLSLYGYGPVSHEGFNSNPALSWAPDLMHQAPLYYGLMLALTATALPISALMTDRRRLVSRLARRTRKAQAQSRIAHQAVAAKSRFLAMISHEMRTPLNAIQGFCEVLRGREDLPLDARYQITAVAESGEALLILIDDLLETSKGDDSLRLASCDLGQVVRQAVAEEAELALSKGLGVRLDLAPLTDIMAVCDAHRLRAALRQLMSNAVKFSHQGEVCLAGRIEPGWLIIQVRDQGGGIPSHFLSQMFDLFTQADDTTGRMQGGSGIGLAAARRHARAMGGDVSLISTSPSGSVFQLKAKIETDQQPPDQPPDLPMSDGSGQGQGRVLIVDDHDLNRSVLRIMIEGAGYQVEEASGGHSALAKLAQSSFRVVLMDLRMPGMDGYEASRRIRQNQSYKRRPIIIAVTADSPLDLAPQLAAAGIDGHLAKPFTRERLMACLVMAMEGMALNAGD